MKKCQPSVFKTEPLHPVDYNIPLMSVFICVICDLSLMWEYFTHGLSSSNRKSRRSETPTNHPANLSELSLHISFSRTCSNLNIPPRKDFLRFSPYSNTAERQIYRHYYTVLVNIIYSEFSLWPRTLRNSWAKGQKHEDSAKKHS